MRFKKSPELVNSDGKHIAWITENCKRRMVSDGKVRVLKDNKVKFVEYQSIVDPLEKILRSLGSPRVAPGSQIRTIALDAAPRSTQGGLCNGV